LLRELAAALDYWVEKQPPAGWLGE